MCSPFSSKVCGGIGARDLCFWYSFENNNTWSVADFTLILYRVWADSVVLPNGTVLILGGANNFRASGRSEDCDVGENSMFASQVCPGRTTGRPGAIF